MSRETKLERSSDYGRFVHNSLNRPISEQRVEELAGLMRKHGFMPSSPIQCRQNGQKLEIIRGHHRFEAAKRLGIAFFFVVDETNTDIFELEGDTHQTWSLADWVKARGNVSNDVMAVAGFADLMELPLGVAASLIAGEGAGSGNKKDAIKNGTFKASPDLTHAYAVASVVLVLRKAKPGWTAVKAAAAAVSDALRVPGVEANCLAEQIAKYPDKIERFSTKEAGLAQIEKIFNHTRRKAAYVPVARLASEISLRRKMSFGKRS